ARPLGSGGCDVSAPKPPVAPPPPPTTPPTPAPVKRSGGCLGFFLGVVGGILILTIGMSTGRRAAGTILVPVPGVAGSVALIAYAKKHPERARMSHAMVIGLALIGLLFGLCNALV